MLRSNMNVWVNSRLYDLRIPTDRIRNRLDITNRRRSLIGVHFEQTRSKFTLQVENKESSQSGSQSEV